MAMTDVVRATGGWITPLGPDGNPTGEPVSLSSMAIPLDESGEYAGVEFVGDPGIGELKWLDLSIEFCEPNPLVLLAVTGRYGAFLAAFDKLHGQPQPLHHAVNGREYRRRRRSR